MKSTTASAGFPASPGRFRSAPYTGSWVGTVCAHRLLLNMLQLLLGIACTLHVLQPWAEGHSNVLHTAEFTAPLRMASKSAGDVVLIAWAWLTQHRAPAMKRRHLQRSSALQSIRLLTGHEAPILVTMTSPLLYKSGVTPDGLKAANPTVLDGRSTTSPPSATGQMVTLPISSHEHKDVLDYERKRSTTTSRAVPGCQG